MNLPLITSELPVFNLLSIGQRGVGKTVFLAGSYLELQSVTENQGLQALFFECQHSQDQDNLENILYYVTQTGKYPPPTMKITDFNFSLKQHQPQGSKTLCQFRWSDIPGEYCDFKQPDFQKMVVDSHSCCVFINAEKLVNNPEYLETLAGIVRQVISIAALIDSEQLKYAFALIFTQCDLLTEGAISRLQIEEKIQSLITSLERAKAKYQRFYSSIPIVTENDTYSLKPRGAASAFLWLVSELHKNHQVPTNKTLGNSLTRDISPIESWFPRSSPRIGLLTLASLGILCVAAAGLFMFTQLTPKMSKSSGNNLQISQYQAILQQKPDDFETLVSLANLYLERGELELAIPLIEKIVQQQPNNLDWQLNLATIYELTEKKPQAERIYDNMLSQDSNNFKALLNKAILRKENGDLQTAKKLFLQAQKVAPSKEWQAKIEGMMP